MAQQFPVDATTAQANRHDFHAHAHAEYDALCATIGERLRGGRLPPDEAYWWARIICTEAMTRLTDRCLAGQRHPTSCDGNCRCQHAAA